MSGLEDGSDDVTIKEAPLPEKASSETVSDNDMSSSVREVYMGDGPGVVSVDVASSELGPGGGSGFVLDEEGHIVTNQHVVEGADEVSVRFASGERERAEIVGEDPSTDVAVVKVSAPEETLMPLTLERVMDLSQVQRWLGGERGRRKQQSAAPLPWQVTARSPSPNA
jgi:putative serine protease PepD